MTAPFSSCAGFPIVGGTLLIPLVGAWTADVELATADQVSGVVSVVIGNLTLSGAVYRSTSYGGQTRARLIGGAGGWRKTISEQGYGTPTIAHVLQDAAAACGETIKVTQTGNINGAYTRLEGPASDVLWSMLSQGFITSWHVDMAGVTQTVPWPTTTIATPFTVTDQRPDEGLIVIATEDYVSWMPGCSFTSPLLQGSYTSGGVNYVWGSDGAFRFEVLTGTLDRFLGAIQQIIARQIAPTRFFGRYEYTISNPSLTTVDASPKDSTLGLPSLQNVPIAADSISSYTPPDGGICHISFLDGLPTKPICVWTDEAPSVTNLSKGTTPVARIGDTVQSMLTIGPPNLTGFLQFAGVGPLVAGVPYAIVPAASSLIGLTPLSGTITTGSESVNST